MTINKVVSLYITSFFLSISGTGHAQSVLDDLTTAISTSKTSVSLRYRSESVAQDNALKDASASTLRTRISWSSGDVYGFSALLEVDNVLGVGPDKYDSFVTDKYRGSYSVIADPVGTEVNQALLKYKPDESNTLIFGNQRILHAGQRFIGGVAWRQNEQTFDALSYQRRTESFNLDYSYIWNVNRIFRASKPSVQSEKLDSESHIALGSYKTDYGTLGFYAYGLDFKEAAALSSVTYGISYAKQFGDLAVNASIATQSDYGDNPLSYSANYFAADLGYNFGVVTATVGYELLGSDDGVVAFSTPLATLHKWQGWSDLFLSTPAAGIQDSYLTLTGRMGKASISATYHQFDADKGGISYGDEWDLVASYPLAEMVTAELKYASYDRDTYAVDTDKLWISLNLIF